MDNSVKFIHPLFFFFEWNFFPLYYVIELVVTRIKKAPNYGKFIINPVTLINSWANKFKQIS